MASITTRIDPTLKVQLQELMADLGLDVSTFVTMAARQAVREQAIPFRVTRDIPNNETIQAMQDAERGIGLSKAFSSVSELMADLESDDDC